MQVSKSKLKAKLLEYLRFVESQEQEIIITDHDKPVLKISKYITSPTTDKLFHSMRGKVQYFEDLTTPTIDEWDEACLQIFTVYYGNRWMTLCSIQEEVICEKYR